MSPFVVVERPLAGAHALVGRRSTLVDDPARPGRLLGVDAWYPAALSVNDVATYELLPDVGFSAVARRDALAAEGSFSLILFSHGRSGNRLVYSQLCESLADRGFVVVALDHPGDTMADWLLGLAADDATNERERVLDLTRVLEALDAGLFSETNANLDDIYIAGHSYGAYAAVASAAVPALRDRIRGIIGLEPYLRTVTDDQWTSVRATTLFLGGARDTTTPPSVDIAAALTRAANVVEAWEFPAIAHQGCSDVGLYLEVSHGLDDLPTMITDYLRSMARDVTGVDGDEWRPAVQLHVDAIECWIRAARGSDRAAFEDRMNLAAARRLY